MWQFVSGVRYSSQTLVSLDVSHNHIGDEGVQHICDALKINRVRPNLFFSLNRRIFSQILTTLSILSNRISDEGARPLADVLKINQVKLFTYLSNATSITGCSCSAHRLWQNWILPKTRLATKESNILLMPWRSIEWDDVSFDSTAHQWDLYHSQSLTTLNLSHNPIGVEGAKYLASALDTNEVRCDLFLSAIDVSLSLFSDTPNTESEHLLYWCKSDEKVSS